jgi:hypothetical protein
LWKATASTTDLGKLVLEGEDPARLPVVDADIGPLQVLQAALLVPGVHEHRAVGLGCHGGKRDLAYVVQ